MDQDKIFYLYCNHRQSEAIVVRVRANSGMLLIDRIDAAHQTKLGADFQQAREHKQSAKRPRPKEYEHRLGEAKTEDQALAIIRLCIPNIVFVIML